jgi:RNA polymerase sigma-70 factor (ECF subfamily)
MSVEDAADSREADREADLRLAHAAGAGDLAAQRELAFRLMDRVRSTARYIVRNDVDADDVAQSAMVVVLHRIGEFRGEGSLARWASRIAARAAWALVRRHRQDAPPPTFGDGSLPADAPRSAQGGAGPLLQGPLVRCLDRLPPERRVTVVLRLLFGMTLEEIAQETEVPVNTARERLRIGRRELRSAALADPVLRDALKERFP